MKRAIVTTVFAILGIGVVILGITASLYHTVFFFTADGYMSLETAVGAGLMKDSKPSFSGGLAFKKAEAGGYDYREGRATAFISRTRHTDIDLVAECEFLGGCELEPRFTE